MSDVGVIPYHGDGSEKQRGEAVAWLREQVQARLAAAKRADTGDPWEEEQHYDALFLVDLKPSAGELVRPEDVRDASLGLELCHPFENPRFLWACHDQATHIVANDPQDVIARCEAELAILDAHGIVRHYCPLPLLGSEHGQLWTPEEGPCWTVCLVASGYRHRPGYGEHWGEPA